MSACFPNVSPGGYSEYEPPDPISNSEVKMLCADGSVGSPHVRVGHCQALIPNPCCSCCRGFFIALLWALTVRDPRKLSGT